MQVNGGNVAGRWQYIEGRWQVKGGKVAVYRGKDAGKWRECGR